MVHENEKELVRLETRRGALSTFREKFVVDAARDERRYINNIYDRVSVPYFNNGYHYKDVIDPKNLSTDVTRELTDRINAYAFCERLLDEWNREIVEANSVLDVQINKKKLVVGDKQRTGKYEKTTADKLAIFFKTAKATQVGRLMAKAELEQREMAELDEERKIALIETYQVILADIEEKIAAWKQIQSEVETQEKTLVIGSPEQSSVTVVKANLGDLITKIRGWKGLYEQHLDTLRLKSDAVPAGEEMAH